MTSTITPVNIDSVGLKITDDNDDISMTFSMLGSNKGVQLDYDINTVTPKYFHLKPSGVEWSDGVTTRTTGLERLASIQEAFSSVQLPPNSSTLQINNRLLASNGTNTIIIDPSNGYIDMSGNDVDRIKSLSGINNQIIAENRVLQTLGPDPSYNALNGYYGLAKDAYPSLNPYSSGVKAVSTWTSRNSAADNLWRAVCWAPELGLFAAVSNSGTSDRIMTSPDGITWTTRTTPNNEWLDITWSPQLGLFAAVGNSGTGDRVMTSPDGITWTSRTSPADINWRSICWAPELGLFVAVAVGPIGTGNRVMTSPNGITWTSRTSAADNDWNSICWAPELSLFVAVAISGTSNRVMTSPNGINWTSRSAAADNFWRSVCWAPELGLFVAVSSNGVNRVMTSTNGINWTSRNAAVADNEWLGLCWAPELGLFVAVSISITGNIIMTSPNGINWTSRTPAAQNEWFSVCWAPELGIFAAVSRSGTGNRVMTSSLQARPPTSYNVFDSSFNSIDASGNWTLKCKELSSSDSNVSIGSTSGNTEIKCNATGAGGTISLTGGTDLLSGSSGSNSGQHLVLTINGVQYKIKLENP